MFQPRTNLGDILTVVMGIKQKSLDMAAKKSTQEEEVCCVLSVDPQ